MKNDLITVGLVDSFMPVLGFTYYIDRNILKIGLEQGLELTAKA